jgi:hypothetical protein
VWGETFNIDGGAATVKRVRPPLIPGYGTTAAGACSFSRYRRMKPTVE